MDIVRVSQDSTARSARVRGVKPLNQIVAAPGDDASSVLRPRAGVTARLVREQSRGNRHAEKREAGG